MLRDLKLQETNRIVDVLPWVSQLVLQDTNRIVDILPWVSLIGFKDPKTAGES
jgi:hypothetical protein